MVWLFSVFFTCVLALPTQKNKKDVMEWQQWREQRESKHRKDPTSFLNAVFLENAEQGDSLSLVVGDGPGDSRWVKGEQILSPAVAYHKGTHIELKIQGEKTILISSQNPRYSFVLKNADVAEVVYGRRTHKLWGYIYDPKKIKMFKGFQFFDYNPQAIVSGVLKKTSPQSISYKTVQKEEAEVKKVGEVVFNWQNQEYQLSAYAWDEPPQSVTLIFVDKTAPQQTYGGGRELVIDLPENWPDQLAVTLDFNRTINFYCAHSPFWHCPVGLQNALPFAIEAGEKNPLKKDKK